MSDQRIVRSGQNGVRLRVITRIELNQILAAGGNGCVQGMDQGSNARLRHTTHQSLKIVYSVTTLNLAGVAALDVPDISGAIHRAEFELLILIASVGRLSVARSRGRAERFTNDGVNHRTISDDWIAKMWSNGINVWKHPRLYTAGGKRQA